MVNATFNNISTISWWPVLLVEETGICKDNHPSVTCYWQTLPHKVVSFTPCMSRATIELKIAVNFCQSNYHTIAATKALHKQYHCYHYVIYMYDEKEFTDNKTDKKKTVAQRCEKRDHISKPRVPSGGRTAVTQPYSFPLSLQILTSHTCAFIQHKTSKD